MTARRPQRPEVFAGAGTETSAADADVEVTASASAREVRALEEPRTRMGADGEPGVLKDDMTRRENLPARLEPGEVHRDVSIRRRIGARLAS